MIQQRVIFCFLLENAPKQEFILALYLFFSLKMFFSPLFFCLFDFPYLSQSFFGIFILLKFFQLLLMLFLVNLSIQMLSLLSYNYFKRFLFS